MHEPLRRKSLTGLCHRPYRDHRCVQHHLCPSLKLVRKAWCARGRQDQQVGRHNGHKTMHVVFGAQRILICNARRSLGDRRWGAQMPRNLMQQALWPTSLPLSDNLVYRRDQLKLRVRAEFQTSGPCWHQSPFVLFSKLRRFGSFHFTSWPKSCSFLVLRLASFWFS